jgi:hypothetical protein
MKPCRILLGCTLVSILLLSGGAGAQVVTEFSAGISAGISGGAGPSSIAVGPDGNLWFIEYDGSRIGRITPSGIITEFSAGISAGAFPEDITAGPDGNLWFTEFVGNRIGRITPLGVVTEFSAGISADAAPVSIVTGPDGNLWFTEPFGNQIGRITTSGVVTEFSAGITAGSSPYFVVERYSVGRYVKVSRVVREEHTLKQSCRGRPGPDMACRKFTRRHYDIEWTIDKQAVAYDKKSDGQYPVMTNDPSLSPAPMLTAHKGQPRIE